MKLLALLTEAFGGRGGIAKFNRDLCHALCAEPLAAKLTALPWRSPVEEMGSLPDGLDYRIDASGSKSWYVVSALRAALNESYDAIICGHIHLVPVGVLIARIQQKPLLLTMHGVEVWEPPSSAITQFALSYVNAFVAVSHCTKERFLQWAPLSEDQGFVVPDCIDLDGYDPGPKQGELLDRYGLNGRTILCTLGRLSAAEQYKGHDEVLEVLPELGEDIPDISYLICGDGDDRERLEKKARRLGIGDRVVFAGYVPEDEKEDHYRLADAFVMPGRGEGFGIVYLEAMACGVPVVASSADASREAVRDGKLGVVVDPDDPESLKDGIRKALGQNGGVPEGLDYFSFERFQKRWHRVMRQVLTTTTPQEKSVLSG